MAARQKHEWKELLEQIEIYKRRVENLSEDLINADYEYQLGFPNKLLSNLEFVSTELSKHIKYIQEELHYFNS